MSKTYKERHALDQRIKIANKFAQTDPDKVVAIVEKHPTSKLPNIANNKFLILKKSRFGVVKTQIEQRLRQRNKNSQSQKQSFSVYINGSIMNNEQTLENIWNKYKEEDGILYFHYREQQAFG